MKKKNIILLMTDQHRYDHVGYTGRGVIDTPNIDRIAGSVGFTNCQTVNPICMPARCALITGKYSHQIGTLSMSGDLSLKHPTFMRALKKAGYHTSGIGKFHFLQTWPWGIEIGKGLNLVEMKEKIKEYGFDYIWETAGKQLALRDYCDYCRYLDEKGLLEAYRDFVLTAGPNSFFPDFRPEDNGKPWPFNEEDYVDIVTTDKIIERIKNRPVERPFYIFGSFCSPHKPFDPPERYLDLIPYEEKDDFIPGEKELSDDDKKMLYKKRRAYKAMIRLIDDQIGRILAALEGEDLLDDTVILFTSDHGEMMGDHFRIQKAVPWRESVNIPLAIRHPDYLHRKLNHSPVEIIDIAATILDIAGLDHNKELGLIWPEHNNIVPCRSLMPMISGEKEQIREFAFSECSCFDLWQLITTEEMKYIKKWNVNDASNYIEEFYDLCNDPKETVNQINNPEYKDSIDWCRRKRDLIIDSTPAAQTAWVPFDY
jgi:arylsulfatase